MCMNAGVHWGCCVKQPHRPVGMSATSPDVFLFVVWCVCGAVQWLEVRPEALFHLYLASFSTLHVRQSVAACAGQWLMVLQPWLAMLVPCASVGCELTSSLLHV